ncbi:MAG: hypothetical protein ACKVT2_14660, partial [Saprospiraceae bacterium]
MSAALLVGANVSMDYVAALNRPCGRVGKPVAGLFPPKNRTCGFHRIRLRRITTFQRRNAAYVMLFEQVQVTSKLCYSGELGYDKTGVKSQDFPTCTP